MKQFLVFAMYWYYPSGGLSDVVGTFNTFEEAKEFAIREYSDYDRVYIWNRDNDVNDRYSIKE